MDEALLRLIFEGIDCYSKKNKKNFLMLDVCIAYIEKIASINKR